ncbi:hypothetical protein ACFXGT_35630 [Streptomyces sp. NPDC059352]|uniref:hypothetical protein n=1 Tax=Streptomyces sp. NPDC059352 TaxID=3346810 RepID=UPI00368A0A2C
MNDWEKLFADADTAVCEPRRPFDVGAGLRRIAQETRHLRPTPARAPGRPSARRRLGAMARVAVTQAGAASHVEELTALLGDDGDVARFDGWTKGVDIEGVQVFACMLYLAHHPESARFWWRFAAGAGSSKAAFLEAAGYRPGPPGPDARPRTRPGRTAGSPGALHRILRPTQHQPGCPHRRPRG